MSESRWATLFKSDKMDWETPSKIFLPLDEEFHFTCDVCATAENTKVPTHYFTPEDDGLAQSWSGVCFMNPPYGRHVGAWIRKAYEESRRGVTVVALVYARTDVKWWHEYAMKADEIRYIRGRIKFVGAKHNAPAPSVVLVFRGQESVQSTSDNLC